LFTDHHEGYLSWAEFERNQRLIADNANSKGLMARGSVRRGETLLAGLLRCGHCGRKLHVAYGGTHGEAGRYHCKGSFLNHGGDRCISFGSLRVDQAVGAEVMRLLKPLGIEAALEAAEVRKTEAAEKRRQLELTLKQARYEAALGTGFSGWAPTWRRRGPIRPPPWRRASGSAVLHEIVVRVENGFVDMVLHWRGGDHTALKVKKNTTGRHRWTVAEETETLVRELARLMPDRAIASVLNRAGKRTGRNNGWTQSRVTSLRNRCGIAVYRDGERSERGEVTLDEAASALNVSPMTVLRMIRRGVLAARQLCKGAPWVIRAADLNDDAVRAEATSRRRQPLTPDPNQQAFTFQ
jgi:excisionase family DNA binding protein